MISSMTATAYEQHILRLLHFVTTISHGCSSEPELRVLNLEH